MGLVKPLMLSTRGDCLLSVLGLEGSRADLCKDLLKASFLKFIGAVASVNSAPTLSMNGRAKAAGDLIYCTRIAVASRATLCSFLLIPPGDSLTLFDWIGVIGESMRALLGLFCITLFSFIIGDSSPIFDS
jgi:hypothetical protein